MNVRHILSCVLLTLAISMTVFFFFNYITLFSFEGIISLGPSGSLKELCLLVEQIALPFYNGSCSVAQLCPTLCDPWIAAHQASLSFTVSQSWLKLMSIELVMPSNHLILCCPLLLPSVFPSIKVFSHESALHIRWPGYWNFGS